MLDYKLVLLFLALHSADTKKYAKQEKKSLLQNNKDCIKIKCPHIDKPVCVKLVHKDGGNETAPLYILMINKCEMKYAKCLKALHAKMVPIENCYHNGTQKAERKRVKRQIQDVASQKIPASKKVTPKPKKAISPVRDETVKNKQTKQYTDHGKSNNTRYTHGKISRTGENKKKNHVYVTLNEKGRENSNYESNYNEREIEERQEQEAKEYEQYDEEDMPEDAADGNVDEEDGNVNEEDGNVDEEDGNVDEEDGNVDGEDNEDDVLNEEEEDVEVDSEQYNADCPTVCPSMGVMVCARNQHGVYRTFLSSCHMRMVMCKNAEEVLELVSRLPCMMTAPYLTEKWMQPKGHIPGEVDEVLRFILCREMTEQSREDDPRCSGIDIEEVPDVSQNENRNSDVGNY